MKTNTELAQQISDLVGFLKAAESTKRHAITNRDNPEFLERSIDALQKSIAKQQAELSKLLFSRDNADAVIAQANDDIISLRKRIKLAKNSRAIAKLLEMQAEINDIKEELGTDDIEVTDA